LLVESRATTCQGLSLARGDSCRDGLWIDRSSYSQDPDAGASVGRMRRVCTVHALALDSEGSVCRLVEDARGAPGTLLDGVQYLLNDVGADVMFFPQIPRDR